MMRCPKCEKDVHPMVDMGEDCRMRHVCPCGTVLGAVPKSGPAKVVASTAAPERLSLLDAPAAPRASSPSSGPATATQLLEMARARLVVVEEELQRMGDLAVERDALRAMLCSMPVTNVVPLKQTKG